MRGERSLNRRRNASPAGTNARPSSLLVWAAFLVGTASSTLARDPQESNAEREAVINPHDFKYILNNPDLCRVSGEGMNMLIWIHSAPEHYKHRTLIRETWGNPGNFRDHNVRTAFFVGDPRNSTLQNMLNCESDKYGDIIEEDFVDSYRNLTYKAIMGLKWVDAYCNSTNIILKADDDMVIDIFRLVRHIQALRKLNIGTERTIMCDVWVGRAVARDPKSKWAVTKNEYAGDMYPPYCPGLALLMTPDLVRLLYVESLRTSYFWVDDVYFTGILPQRLNVTYHSLSSLTSFGVAKPENYLSLESDYLFIHVHGADLFLHIWRKMTAQQLKTVGSG